MQLYIRSNDQHSSTEIIRRFLINNGKHQFDGNAQSDPQELMMCFFALSKSLQKLFQFETQNTMKCTEWPKECPEMTYLKPVEYYSLEEAFTKGSVNEIIKHNRNYEVYCYCNICQKDTKKEVYQSFKSEPEF